MKLIIFCHCSLFLSGRAKDLSAPLYRLSCCWQCHLIKLFLFAFVSWLRLFFVLSLQRPGFNTRIVYVCFVVGKVTVGQFFIPVLRFSRVCIILPVLHTYPFFHRDAIYSLCSSDRASLISLVLKNQLDASNIQKIFCHRTLHVSGIFCAHHQD
jgi:hypothetical protein